MRRKPLISISLLVLVASTISLPWSWLVRSGWRSCSASSAVPMKNTMPVQARLLSAYGKLPLDFEENQGQTDSHVKFVARGNGYTLFLTGTDATLRLDVGSASAKDEPGQDRLFQTVSAVSPSQEAKSAILRLAFEGTNHRAEVSGLELQPGRSNYFIGNKPEQWHRNVPHYARVKYQAVYPGIDLVYYGNQGQLESDYVVSPGADPRHIGLHIEGAKNLKLDPQGDLILATAVGDLSLHQPLAYQVHAGTRKSVVARYILHGSRSVGIQVASYDSRLPLIIDPVVVYSTFLGGSKNDVASAIAVDASGNAYVTGFTNSLNFPTLSFLPGQATFVSTQTSAQEVFVTKLNSAGSALVYSTYLGGTGSGVADQGFGIAVNSSNQAFITGTTSASDFPTTCTNAFNCTIPNPAGTVFLTQLDSTGSALLYSTFLGGSGRELAFGIALDPAGIAYITGNTNSPNFPVTAGTFQSTDNVTTANAFTAFISKIDTTKSGTPSLVYSTYFGGSGGETAFGIAADANGNAYITGETASSDLPIPPSPAPFQASLHQSGVVNAFVSQLNTTTSTLVYSSYLGGSGTSNGGGDQGNAIALDPNLNVYIAGTTGSLDFPVTSGAFQTTNPNTGKLNRSAFVARFDTTKSGSSSLIYSTYLGGSGSLGDSALSIVVDSLQQAYVTGHTTSANFPVAASAPQPNLKGANAYVSVFNPTGTGLIFSTFWGGEGSDTGFGMAIDKANPPNIYIAGSTDSSFFTTTASAFQRAIAGSQDAFITKFTPAAAATSVTLAPAALAFGNQPVNTTSTAQTITLTNGSSSQITGITITITGTNASDFTRTATTCGTTLAAGANCTISIAFRPTITGAESATLQVTDSDPSSPQLAALSGTGSTAGQADFSLSLNPAQGTVTAGGTANFSVTVTSLNSFASSVSLTCTGAPAASTCILNPTAVTPAANATATSSGTIKTTALLIPVRLPRGPRPYPWIWLCTMLSLAVAFFAAQKMAHRTSRKFIGAFALLMLTALAGCSGPIRGATKTPKGTATLTVKGTSGTISHSTTFTLTVQ
jgi:hypothetical protein